MDIIASRPGTAAKKAGSKRDQSTTRERILAAGRAEFSAHGLNGARMERISRRSRCNIRMLYHHFGSKSKFYLTVLEDTYRRLREMEQATDFLLLDPKAGMQRLIEFTYDYVWQNPTYVRMLMNENLLQGKFLKKSKAVPETTPSRVHAIKDLLLRGQNSGVFRGNIDPVQLFVSILALCYVHASNRYTLSIMFQQDVSDRAWLAERRSHVVEVVLSFLKSERRTEKNDA